MSLLTGRCSPSQLPLLCLWLVISFAKQGILSSGSVLLNQASPVYGYFEPLMQPWVHYVPYSRWFDDLPANVRRLQQDDQLAQRISAAGRLFEQKYTSLEAAADYMAILLNRYSELLADEVTDDDVALLDCPHSKDGPMGCDKGWKEWDGIKLQYPEAFREKKAAAAAADSKGGKK